jgi:hypothetical protein
MSKPAPPSLPQLRTSLKAALSAERDADRRKEIGRALKAIERCEAKEIASAKQSC